MWKIQFILHFTLFISYLIAQDDSSQRKADIECQNIKSRIIPPLDLHILDGEVILLGEFPHMVAIGFDKGNGFEFACGGTLISNEYVLTAAHCMNMDPNVQVKQTIVRAGVVDISGSEWNADTDMLVLQTFQHPKYTSRFKYHDIALLRLEKPVEFNSNVNAACLHTSIEDPTSPLTIIGWGTTNVMTEERSNVLMKANVVVVSREECQKFYTVNPYRKLPDGIASEQICAGDPDGLRDTCQGDSGGPLLEADTSAGDTYYRVVGVTSFGRGCAADEPGIYIRVASYLDWIESVVWPQSRCLDPRQA